MDARCFENPGTSDCVQMSLSDGRWNDTYCPTKLQFLCSKNPTETVSPGDMTPLTGTCFGRKSSQSKPGSKVTVAPGTSTFEFSNFYFYEETHM